MNGAPVDLKARAYQAMLAAGFHPNFPPAAMQQLQLQQKQAPAPSQPQVRDLRSLPWSSLDNDNSRDLDQVEYVERSGPDRTRLLVGIADVDYLVPRASALDQHAAAEATSVYTGVATFPMLPTELSTNASSLLDGQERLALVAELHILDSGETESYQVYPALLRNQAKLAYSSVGAWLEGHGSLPPAAAAVPGMDQQLKLQQETAERLRAVRKQHGALTFSSNEPVPVMDNGQLKNLAVRQHNAAEDIIESFMVAANVATAEHLRQSRMPALRRVVKTPKRWDRIQTIATQFKVKLPDAPDPRALCEFLEQRQAADPAHFPDLSLSIVKLLGPGEYIVESPGAEKEGHFGLAVTDYTHSTAPNRRYADLVTQRLLKSTLGATPAAPYSEADLNSIATHCTDREDAARKVERFMRKVVAASLLSARIGEEFKAIITGASPKGTYARLLDFPAEGRIIRGYQGLDVGDKVVLRLTSVQVEKGFIDFEKR